MLPDCGVRCSRLEPYEAKVSRTVLRGPGASNTPQTILQKPRLFTIRSSHVRCCVRHADRTTQRAERRDGPTPSFGGLCRACLFPPWRLLVSPGPRL